MSSFTIHTSHAHRSYMWSACYTANDIPPRVALRPVESFRLYYRKDSFLPFNTMDKLFRYRYTINVGHGSNAGTRGRDIHGEPGSYP